MPDTVDLAQWYKDMREEFEPAGVQIPMTRLGTQQVLCRIPKYVYPVLVKLAERVGQPPSTFAAVLLAQAVGYLYEVETGKWLMPASLLYPHGPFRPEPGDEDRWEIIDDLKVAAEVGE
jgi:hypothetical protein